MQVIHNACATQVESSTFASIQMMQHLMYKLWKFLAFIPEILTGFMTFHDFYGDCLIHPMQNSMSSSQDSPFGIF
jgi:hypothetical protein